MPAKIALQPVVPGIMPDLNHGYPFNAERHLEGEGEPGGVDAVGTGQLINVNVNKLVYSGSIIGGNFRKAIVSFPAAAAVGPKLKLLNRRMRAPAKLEHTMLKEGDILGSYRVAAIFPDKIVFKRGEETLEKFLYDPDKKRSARVEQVRAAAPKNKPGGVRGGQEKIFSSTPVLPKNTPARLRSNQSSRSTARQPLPGKISGDPAAASWSRRMRGETTGSMLPLER